MSPGVRPESHRPRKTDTADGSKSLEQLRVARLVATSTGLRRCSGSQFKRRAALAVLMTASRMAAADPSPIVLVLTLLPQSLTWPAARRRSSCVCPSALARSTPATASRRMAAAPNDADEAYRQTRPATHRAARPIAHTVPAAAAPMTHNTVVRMRKASSDSILRSLRCMLW